MPKREPPIVEVPTRLHEPHEAVRWLLRSLKRDPHAGVVGFDVGPRKRSRALCILDAVCKVLEARGSRVIVGKVESSAEDEQIVVVAGERGLPLAMVEGDGGRLRLQMLYRMHGRRNWWRDDGRRALEEKLADAVVAIEEAVHSALVLDAEERERRKNDLAGGGWRRFADRGVMTTLVQSH
jgi:hypothetical protein